MNIQGPSTQARQTEGRTVRLRRGGVLSFATPPGAVEIVRVETGVLALSALLADGRRQIMSLATPGEMLSSACGAGCRIEALSAATVVVRTIAHAGEMLASMFEHVHRRLVATSERLTVLGRYTAAERTAAFLVELADRLGAPAEDGAVETPLPLSRDDIADYVGLKSETMSRQFTRFRKDGLITFPSRDRCRIHNIESMRAMQPAFS